MEAKSNYNPTKIKEGLLSRFFRWLKKWTKLIFTVGFLTLLFTAWPVIKPLLWTEPDPVVEVLVGWQKDTETMVSIVIPDSMLSYEEISLLKNFQDEFESYKLQLHSLNLQETKNGENGRTIAASKLLKLQAFMENSQTLYNKLMTIVSYETAIDSSFLYKIDVERLNELSKANDAFVARLISVNKEMKFVSNNDVKVVQLCNDLIRSAEIVSLLEEQQSFYKSFYLQCNVRLRECLKNEQK